MCRPGGWDPTLFYNNHCKYQSAPYREGPSRSLAAGEFCAEVEIEVEIEVEVEVEVEIEIEVEVEIEICSLALLAYRSGE